MVRPYLLLAFAGDLAALVAVTIFAGVDAATALDLHTIALGLAGALAGAHVPIGTRGP